jgi:hypothetical protein
VRVSAEREREHLGAGIEELELELAIADRSRLTDEVVEPWLGDGPVALFVDVSAVRVARRMSCSVEGCA